MKRTIWHLRDNGNPRKANTTRRRRISKSVGHNVPPVDSGYRGETHAIINNVSNKPQKLSKGTRVGRLVITLVVIGIL